MESKKSSRRNNGYQFNPRRRRRRSHSRKTLSNCLFNFAEARKEVVMALHHHRSSKITTTTTTTTTTQYGSCLGRRYGTFPRQDYWYYYYNYYNYPNVDEKVIGPFSPFGKAQMEGVNGPTQPIWEGLDIDDVVISHDDHENRWWVGFLESLDGKSESQEEAQKPNLVHGPGLLGQAHESSSSSGLDEWVESPNPDDVLKGDLLLCDLLN